ncbi:MAG: isoprenylcysteine carboxylmethyltransferase family protein [Marinilabiliaceae bacterium]|nr:isoprenylcysteine carboxylmethyltransferase family protein [Marinilabiliaceae bacterium]
MLKRRGIQAFVFGRTHKGDLLLVPIMLLLVYTAIASSLSLPFPDILLKPLFDILFISWFGILINIVGLTGFAFSLKDFGTSFRVGIDVEKPDKLVTDGMFSISRNPIYVSFIFFFLGLTLLNANIASFVMLFCFFIPALHRQIIREEHFMKGHYGDSYTEYCKKIRRYL